MRNRALTLGLLLLCGGTVRAQDMPLSQILVEGEGWRLADAAQAAGLLPARGEPGQSVRTQRGTVYRAERSAGAVVIEHRQGAAGERLGQPGLKAPSGVTLSPDGGTLVVGDAEGKHLWAFRVEKDGSLGAGERYYALRVRPGQQASGVTALATDILGRVYAATPLGVQVFDPTGRLCGVLLNPRPGEAITGLGFGGADGSLLTVACGEAVFVRKTQAKGIRPVSDASQKR